MSDTIITVENLSKRYRLGTIGATSLREGAERAWHKLRGRNWQQHMGEIGVANQQRAKSEEQRSDQRLVTSDQRPDPNDLWALRDVSFEVKRGEVLGVIGRNGAGKSTLLKLLTRITEPTSGRAIMRGRVASLLEVGTGFHPELTGRENVYLNGAILGMRRAEITAKFDEIVAFAEVEKFIDTPVKRYSSGMYVRLAFAVAAHLEPEILLVDEVLAVGDVGFQKKCINKMWDVAKEGRTVLFVSHNMSAISKLCSNAILLESGELKDIGSPKNLISEYLFGDDQSTDIIIREMQHNRGQRKAEITRGIVKSRDGLLKNDFLINESIILEAQYVVKENIDSGIAFWVIICLQDGTPLMTAHQNDIGYFSVIKGKHTMQIIINDPRLLPGKYQVMAGIFDFNHDFQDWVDGFQSFSVCDLYETGRKFDRRWGVVEADVIWKTTAEGV